MGSQDQIAFAAILTVLMKSHPTERILSTESNHLCAYMDSAHEDSSAGFGDLMLATETLNLTVLVNSHPTERILVVK
jgi:hypothetical protein